MATDFIGGRVTVISDDITTVRADAIVNAANNSLLGGGGVDGAIHKAGGYLVLEACKALRESTLPKGLPTGQAVATTAGNLNARYLIHTVGPVWHGGFENESELLASCYRNSLRVAENLGCKTVAFPSISTGVYCYPPEKAAVVVSSVLTDYFSEAPKLDKVILVFFTPKDERLFLSFTTLGA